MIDVVKVGNFMKAALDTGRTHRDVIEMLTNNEIVAVVDKATANFSDSFKTVRAGTRFSYSGPFGYLFDGRKIDAIKCVRTMTGCGLKEAKDFVEGAGFLGVTPDVLNCLKAVFGIDNVYSKS